MQLIPHSQQELQIICSFQQGFRNSDTYSTGILDQRRTVRQGGYKDFKAIPHKSVRAVANEFFPTDAIADSEGLLEVNRKICKQQMAEKASPTPPTNCAVLP